MQAGVIRISSKPTVRLIPDGRQNRSMKIQAVDRNAEMEARTCPRGAFKLSHETRPASTTCMEHPTPTGTDGERSETFASPFGWAEPLLRGRVTCRPTSYPRGANLNAPTINGLELGETHSTGVHTNNKC